MDTVRKGMNHETRAKLFNFRIVRWWKQFDNLLHYGVVGMATCDGVHLFSLTIVYNCEWWCLQCYDSIWGVIYKGRPQKYSKKST